MLFDERLMIEAAAASVFIAAGAWGAVNAMLVALAAMRYVPMRAERLGDSAPPVPVRSFVLHPLLVASLLMWPGAVVFFYYWSVGSMPRPLGWVVLAAWPIAAAVLLVLGGRSEWTKTRVWLARAAGSKKPELRDDLLARALDEDPGIRAGRV